MRQKAVGERGGWRICGENCADRVRFELVGIRKQVLLFFFHNPCSLDVALPVSQLYFVGWIGYGSVYKSIFFRRMRPHTL